jgi:hypothetical protein
MVKKLECIYCGESVDDVPLIPKPKFFIFENRMNELVNLNEEGDLICLECMDYELNELKDCY